MKKMILIVILALVMQLLTGCSGGNSPAPSATISSSGETPVSSNTPDDATLAEAEAFLQLDPTASEIGIYLRERYSEISQGAGNLLLERLILAQLDPITVMNSKIYEDDYLNALNVTMGGILDPTKIADIENETVRDEFQAISDGLMTIVRYEETPVLEPDWNALDELNVAFGEREAQLTILQSRIQGRYYAGDPHQFDLLAEDIVFTENLIKETDGFVRWQLSMLYKHQIGNLIFGPEGSYLEEFVDKNADAIERITRYSQTYNTSEFGALCSQMLALSDSDMTTLSEAINEKLTFPPGDTRTLTFVESESNGIAIRVPEISDPNNQIFEEINQTILSTASGLAIADIMEQSISVYVSFINENYISVDMMNSYIDSDGNYHLLESFLTLDLTTGATVTLDDLVGSTFDSYKDTLLSSMIGNDSMTALSEPVNYMLYDSGLQIMILNDSGTFYEYYTVTYHGLAKIMDIEKLF